MVCRTGDRHSTPVTRSRPSRLWTRWLTARVERLWPSASPDHRRGMGSPSPLLPPSNTLSWDRRSFLVSRFLDVSVPPGAATGYGGVGPAPLRKVCAKDSDFPPCEGQQVLGFYRNVRQEQTLRNRLRKVCAKIFRSAQRIGLRLRNPGWPTHSFRMSLKSWPSPLPQSAKLLLHIIIFG